MQHLGSVFWILTAFIAFGVVLLIAGMLVGRALRTRLRRDAAGSAFSLAELRQMHRDGQIDDEEYERLRAGLIGRLPGAGRAAAPPSMDVHDALPPDAPS
jgi:uncharacterized membrane protein